MRPPPASKVLSLRWSLLKENRIPPFVRMVLFLCACIIPYFCQRLLGVSAYFNNYFNSILIFIYLFIPNSSRDNFDIRWLLRSFRKRELEKSLTSGANVCTPVIG